MSLLAQPTKLRSLNSIPWFNAKQLINGLDFLAFVFLPAEIERTSTANDVAEMLRAVEPTGYTRADRQRAIPLLARARRDMGNDNRLQGLIKGLEDLFRLSLQVVDYGQCGGVRGIALTSADLVGFAASTGYPKIVALLLSVMHNEQNAMQEMQYGPC